MTEEQRQRLRNEAQQLADRGEKLNKFLETPAFDALPDTDQTLLGAQMGVMGAYLAILHLRLERAQPEPFTGDMEPGLLDVQQPDEDAGDFQ